MHRSPRIGKEPLCLEDFWSFFVADRAPHVCRGELAEHQCRGSLNYYPNATGAVESVHTSLASINSSGAVGPPPTTGIPALQGAHLASRHARFTQPLGSARLWPAEHLRCCAPMIRRGLSSLTVTPRCRRLSRSSSTGASRGSEQTISPTRTGRDPSKWATGCPTDPEHLFQDERPRALHELSQQSVAMRLEPGRDQGGTGGGLDVRCDG